MKTNVFSLQTDRVLTIMMEKMIDGVNERGEIDYEVLLTPEYFKKAGIHALHSI